MNLKNIEKSYYIINLQFIQIQIINVNSRINLYLYLFM